MEGVVSRKQRFPVSVPLTISRKITCGIALFAYIFIVRFPDEEREKPSFKFLKPDETEFIIERLEKDRGDVEVEKFSWIKFLTPAKDFEIWGFAFIFL